MGDECNMLFRPVHLSDTEMLHIAPVLKHIFTISLIQLSNFIIDRTSQTTVKNLSLTAIVCDDNYIVLYHLFFQLSAPL